MIISDDIHVMLLVEPFFKSFTNKEIVDATKSAEAILALEVGGRQRVDERPSPRSVEASCKEA